MKIFVVRHGADDPGYRGGWSDRGLSATGREQALKLTDRIDAERERWGIRTIISSDLARASETASVIAQRLGLQCEHLNAWREIDNGLLAGIPNDEAEKRFPGKYFSSLEMNERYPGGESPREFYLRIQRAWSVLILSVEKGAVPPNVLLVTHGGVISILHTILDGQDWSNRELMRMTACTGVHVAEHSHGVWRIVNENDSEHLRRP